MKLEKEERELAASEAKVLERLTKVPTGKSFDANNIWTLVCVVECSPEAVRWFQHICSVSESVVSDPTGEKT